MTETRRRVSGRVIPHRAGFAQRLAARLVYHVILANSRTHWFPLYDPDGGLETAWREPVIYAIWHNRLAYSVILHRRFVRRGAPDRRMAALVSASRDGALLASILEAFGVEPVRGSSSRRGAQALVELRSWAGQGLDLAITPDGPRGPAYQVQPGVAAIAAVTGRAIVPVTWNTRWKVRIRSWDRFQIPLPLGRCEARFAAPVRVSSNEPAAIEAGRLAVQEALKRITRD